MQTRWDVIVIGLGAVGSAALYQFAKRGVKVLGIDRFHPPHDRGSSHGETRVTRLALGEGDHYVQFVKRSHEIWRELESATGKSLLHQVGGLIFGSESSKSDAHGKGDFLGATIKVATAQGIAHEVLSASEMEARFPQFKFRGDECGYFEPSAGYLRPEACVAAQLQEAKCLGATVFTGEQVLRWGESGELIHLSTDKDEYETARLVLCAGPWMPELLSALARKVQVYRQVQFWFEPDGNLESFYSDRMPVFVHLPGDATGMFYGMPVIDKEATSLKIAGEQFETPCKPDELILEVTEDEKRAMHDRAAPSLRISSNCVRAKSCQYTVTPDFDFVIDRLPDCDHIWFASACSGHGFKHSAAVGEALSQVVSEGRASYDLSTFRCSRFRN